MNILDRARIEWAVKCYDWWLDLHGAPLRRRRELRRELRSNLCEAAAAAGARAAVQSLGSTRRMAADALPHDRSRPRWSAGASAGLAALAVVIVVEFLAALAWLDGVMATDPTRTVRGSMALFPGSSLEHEPLAGGGFSLLFGPGWLCLAIGATVFVSVARPWRAITKGRRSRDAVAA